MTRAGRSAVARQPPLDREQKREWYARYGVRELWLVDPVAGILTVFDFVAAPEQPASFRGAQTVRSRVLPRLRLRLSSTFQD